MGPASRIERVGQVRMAPGRHPSRYLVTIQVQLSNRQPRSPHVLDK